MKNKKNKAMFVPAALIIAALFLFLMVSPIKDGEKTTQSKVIGREGKGCLLNIDGTRVLLLAGSPYEMGYQQGKLLKKDINMLMDVVLKVISETNSKNTNDSSVSLIEDVFKRTAPFIPKRYREEIEGVAAGADLPLEKAQLAGLFPELFHCSGFALFGNTTKGGQLLHGRILDYMTGVGLQNFAVVTVAKPDGFNAFVTVGYAGFTGSVTGMNEKQIAIGQMGGEGYGDWDGLPMAYLIRKVLEEANSLEEAISIFQNTPRTCEHYYVISDGEIPDARGLVCTPTKFEVIKPNQSHSILSRLDPYLKTRQLFALEPIKDAVLMSTGEDRYKELVSRVKSNYGKIDSEGAKKLMLRPVAMEENLHDVLFAPATLDLWVANAANPTEDKYQACFQKYYHYNLKDLLDYLTN